jgi:hypothetical protein
VADVAKVLRCLKGTVKQRQRAYREYVDSGVLEGLSESPWARVSGQVVLGDEEFLERVQPLLKGDSREQVGVESLRRQPKKRWVVGCVSASCVTHPYFVSKSSRNRPVWQLGF